LVVSQSLEGGGAERVITILLRYLDRQRFRPSLVLFAGRGPFLDEIPPDVPVYDLGERSAYNFLRTAARLRYVIGEVQPAVILSLLKHPNLVTLLVCRTFFRAIPVVISERDTLSLTLATDRARLLKRLLHRQVYPCARKIIAVSNGVKEDLERNFGISGSRIQVIYNPCDVERIQRMAVERPDLEIDWGIPTVVAAGRLTAQKDFSSLLHAFAIVARKCSCQLVILGEGEERRALARQAAEMGLSDQIVMPGFRRNPFAYMRRGQVFVLSSLWEGLANAILEAMACGIPVVSTDCPVGPGEIITHGVNGLLVPPADPAALAGAIEQVLADRGLAARLAEGGCARVQAFSHDVIIPQYEVALEMTNQSRRHRRLGPCRGR
jgi:glycosyltransferase involved in cell wall biosynthesis